MTLIVIGLAAIALSGSPPALDGAALFQARCTICHGAGARAASRPLLAAAGAQGAADGSALFKAKCTACHGADGKGTPVGQRLGAHDLTALEASEAKIVKTITNGDGKMPAFKGKLTDDEIRALARFVKAGLK
jgi:cytochrome c6